VGSRGKAPVEGLGEAEAFLLMNAQILTFWSNKISKRYLIWGRLQILEILGGSGPHVTPLDPPLRRRVLYYDLPGGACRALTFALARLSCYNLLTIMVR